jgi:MSHA biogenesis protein MshN
MAQGDIEMSVINKMLRDLDSRQVGKNPADVPQPFGHDDLTAGTVALNGAAGGVSRLGSTKTWGLVLVLSLLMACVGLVVWMSQQPTNAPDVGSVAALPVPALVRTGSTPIADIPAVTAVVAPAAAKSAVAPVSAAVPVAGQLSPIVAAVAPTVPSHLPSKADHAPAVAETTTKSNDKPQTKIGQAMLPVGQLKETTEFSSYKRVNRQGPSARPVVSADKAVSPATPAAPVVAVEAPRPRQNAAQEVLSQAQERWTLGDRTQAIALLHSAIERLEASPTGNSAALAALVREYVHMTLIQGQTSAAWAVLSSLEPALADVADIWALRGNVAQRLGLHPEAVRAYLKGLELRPDEPRWMLGAAVSLAAQGQVGPAADLAEKARLAGALRPDVANYLRQLGVAVRTD